MTTQVQHQKISTAKRMSFSPIDIRGCPQQPYSVAADEHETVSVRQRVLTVKLETDWKDPASKAVFNRLRELGWQAAHYRNTLMRAGVALAMGWREDPEAGDKNDLIKQARRIYKGELSGSAYSAAEREVTPVLQRNRSAILAGSPLPEWRPNSALSIRGHKNKNESGVRLELEYDQFVAYLQVQNKSCEGSCWIRVPIAKNTRRDEFQSPLLLNMVAWSVPIAKATVQVKPHCLMLNLTYAVNTPIPRMGNRVATLGPVRKDGTISLRTETQTKDYSSILAEINDKKDRWDAIRRRVTKQIGRHKGHARTKRVLLSRVSTEDWLKTKIHTWSRQIIDWLETQGVGTLRIESIETGDWPAAQMILQLKYKGQDAGITVEIGADVLTESGDRAAKAETGKAARSAKKRKDAVRELTHQIADIG